MVRYFCCQKKEDIPIIDRVLQAHPWASRRLDVGLQPYAICEADGYNAASIFWPVDVRSEEQLQALQEEVEQKIEAQGVRLRRHRRDQQPFHITVASVRENQYSTLPSIQQLNVWLGAHPFPSSFPLGSPCFHTGRAAFFSFPEETAPPHGASRVLRLWGLGGCQGT